MPAPNGDIYYWHGRNIVCDQSDSLDMSLKSILGEFRKVGADLDAALESLIFLAEEVRAGGHEAVYGTNQCFAQAFTQIQDLLTKTEALDGTIRMLLTARNRKALACG
ncbi:hypothetical protein [Streptomyces lavendulae]|uniref:hypothetical protein n=1 Tax=Streptomyces lavendulae TaxID=1914 RepID=UPI0031E5C3A0